MYKIDVGNDAFYDSEGNGNFIAKGKCGQFSVFHLDFTIFTLVSQY